MAELRIELPTVVTVLASAEACDGVEHRRGASLLRVAPGEVMRGRRRRLGRDDRRSPPR